MEADMESLLRAEVELKIGSRVSNNGENLPGMDDLQRGDYKSIIENDFLRKLFIVPDDNTFDTSCPLDFMRNIVNYHLTKDISVNDQFRVLCSGIACMNAFVQTNWTGPKFECPPVLLSLLEPALRKVFPADVPQFRDLNVCARLALSEDGEEIYDSIENPELLVVALAVFSCNFPNFMSAEWWNFRAVYIQQQILDEQSPTLLGQLENLGDKILNSKWIRENKHLSVLSRLELTRVYLHFGRVSFAEDMIRKVLSLLQMDIHLTGALGRRTFYQQRDIAQLSISVNIHREHKLESDVALPNVDFPKDILLNDDVRMPSVVFTDPSDGGLPDLTPLEQAALLATFVLKKKSQAKDHLQNEELIPYLNCILAHPKVWSFHFSSLHLRSRLECDHKRTVERSLLQTQALMEMDSNKTPAQSRLQLFYCSYAPPSFILSSECASILVSLGSFQSALDIYLNLKMWDEVITCYNFLKLRHKAAEVIQEQLKKGATVKLLCYLGDATDDVSCYEQAWELSNHKSAQAQRHWGMFYFQKKMYKDCIEHFNISLNINSLQIALWFRLGYANLIEHNWADSAAAYRRYCVLEPGSFEAWNNMAKAYILLGQKRRAFMAFQEAIKCNYETWQVWDNLMAVSSDCGEFEEVIHCYHRILDLKDKHTDEQILTVLTTVIVNNVKDCRGQPTSLLRKKALELFGRITSRVMGNPTIWMLYAQLTASVEEQNEITRSKVVNYYQKAYTSAVQDNSWCRDIESMQKVLKICEKLAEAHLDVAKSTEQSTQSAQSLSSAKFSLANVIAKVNQQLECMDKSQVTETFVNDLSSLQNTLESVTAELTRVKS